MLNFVWLCLPFGRLHTPYGRLAHVLCGLLVVLCSHPLLVQGVVCKGCVAANLPCSLACVQAACWQCGKPAESWLQRGLGSLADAAVLSSNSHGQMVVPCGCQQRAACSLVAQYATQKLEQKLLFCPGGVAVGGVCTGMCLPLLPPLGCTV